MSGATRSTCVVWCPPSWSPPSCWRAGEKCRLQLCSICARSTASDAIVFGQQTEAGVFMCRSSKLNPDLQMLAKLKSLLPSTWPERIDRFITGACCTHLQTFITLPPCPTMTDIVRGAHEHAYSITMSFCCRFWF